MSFIKERLYDDQRKKRYTDLFDFVRIQQKKKKKFAGIFLKYNFLWLTNNERNNIL